MPLPASSRIEEINRAIAAIANVPKATREVALKAATALVASYPGQQSSDPIVAKAYMQQLVSVCTGVDLDVLQAMLDVNLSTSLVRQERTFMPTPAKVAEWIDWKMQPKRSRIGWYLDEIAAIEKAAEEQALPADERQARAEKLLKVSAEIRAAAKALRRASPKLDAWQATETEAAVGREEGLKRLEDMRGGY